jgi:two-component system sensor histidine kinase BaeS
VRPRRGIVPTLRRQAIRVQLPLVLVAIPGLLALHATWIPAVVASTLAEGADADRRDAITAGARAALVVAVALVAAAAAAAALLLRGTIRAVVEHIHAVTEAIARGEFTGRVASRRQDELGKLAHSIDSMAERLERLEHARRRMLACVSHELRTPLTIVQGHAFSLARTEAVASRTERLELIQHEAARLAALVDELVEASSIHAGGMRIRPEAGDLVELVGAQVARHAELAAARHVAIELRCVRHRVPAAVDPERFDRLVGNLLANAVRHAPRGSTVGVGVDERRDGSRVVEVTNPCGPFPEELARRVFEPFVQGEHRRGGVGLGLTIAHGIASAHGGRLELDVDAAMRGTARFRLVLPAPAPTLDARSVRTRRVGAARRIAPAAEPC